MDFVFTHADGRKTRVHNKKSQVQTKAGAEAYERQLRQALLEGKHNVKESPTLADFRTQFLERYAAANKHKPSGIESKRSILDNHLVPKLGKKRLDEIGTLEVDELKAAMSSLSPKTVNNALNVLSKALGVAVKWGLLDRLHCEIEPLKAPKPSMEFYEEEMLEKLLVAAHARDPRDELVVLLGAEAGLRAGEMVGLEWPDVDFGRGQLTINRTVWRKQVNAPKGGKSRVVPLSDRLAAALRAHRHLRSPRVLCEVEGGAIRQRWLATTMERLERCVGLVVKGRVHILRHTFGARLAMSDAPAKAIQELMGHANLSTTMRYMHLSPQSKVDAIKNLSRGSRLAPAAHAERSY